MNQLESSIAIGTAIQLPLVSASQSTITTLLQRAITAGESTSA